MERGEDFFTLQWPTQVDEADKANNAREAIIYNIVVSTMDGNNRSNNTITTYNDKHEAKCKRVEVLNEEVSPYSSTLHSHKANKQNGNNEKNSNSEEAMTSKL